MSEQRKTLAAKEVDEILDEALNSACLTIQQAIGQTDGGVAGMFFSGDNRETFIQLFRQYIDQEMQMAGDEEGGRLKDALIANGFVDVSTGGGFSALEFVKGAYYILLTNAVVDSSKVTTSVPLYLGYYTVSTGEEISSREGFWGDLEAYVNNFVSTGEVPEPLPNES